jgi:hypothetical protein
MKKDFRFFGLSLWYILAISLALSVFVFALVFLFTDQTIYDVHELDMDVYIGNELGFNVDTDAVHFGVTQPGSVGMRPIKVTAGEFLSLVSIEASGEMSGWITISENDFILQPYENRSVQVYLQVPEDAEMGGYFKGTLRVVFRKA